MAGAGFKTFNTGDVLTASDVNTYLMQQTTMVFADASARSTALGANVAEGMISYLKDTDALEKYDGSAWVSASGSTSPLTTKGDLYTYSTTNARLPVGSNGYTLVADSSTSTGLAYSPTFFAGKNAIINGDFSINQRAFTSTTTSATYGFDRWKLSAGVNGVCTYSAQTFTAGTAPVAGYEGKNFARIVSTSQSANTDFTAFLQPIENVRTFANQTVTVSFWAKAASGTPNIGVTIGQNFGTGGSPSSTVLTSPAVKSITTSWARYSFNVSVPSISGKTLGTNNNDNLETWIFTSCGTSISALGYAAVGLQNATIDIWGVQIEAGSTATQFQTATGTIQGELAACQRYYYRINSSSNAYAPFGFGTATATTQGDIPFKYAQTMRVAPTSIDFANLCLTADNTAVIAVTNLTFVTAENSPDMGVMRAAATGLTTYQPYILLANNSTAAYVGVSAEL